MYRVFKEKLSLKNKFRLSVFSLVILSALIGAALLIQERRESEKSLRPTLSVKKITEGKLVAEVFAAATGVTRVEVYREAGVTDVLIGSDTTAPYTVTWNTTSLTDGSYTIYAKAYDAATPTPNVGTSANVTVTVDNTRPTVSITAPTSGATVSGPSVTVSANAADASGINKVEFYYDGTNL